jgi:hypothetical protein
MARKLTFGDVVTLCASFPGIEVGTSYGTPAIKVKGKLLVRLKEDGENIVLRTTFVVRDHLIHTQSSVFFLTDHYRDYPMVLVRLHSVAKMQLYELIEATWRESAPKGLVTQFDQTATRARKPD